MKRLINKKPAPSRKNRPKRGPKHDNRRRRVQIGDSDLSLKDSDLSMSGKVSSELSIAARVADGFQSSYGVEAGRAMSTKTATYHGVLKQGHPDGPYPGYTSYDKRYFGKVHYDSIVASAKDFLKGDWLANAWEGGAPDAPVRAALDLAIHTADDCLYQSKIDVETYNMLLARLTGDKTDLFSETLLPNTDAPKRSASSMSNAHQDLMRIASDLRASNPKAAIEIVRSLRAMTAQQQMAPADPPMGQQGQQQAAPPAPPPPVPPPPPAKEGEGDAKKEPKTSQVSEKDTDDFLAGKVDIKDLKADTQKLIDAKDMDDFVEGLTDLAELMKKTAAGKTAGEDHLKELADLEDMDEEQVKKLIADQQKNAEKLMKFLEEDDLEQFMAGLDDLFQEVGEAAKGAKTASVRVSMTTLIRVAAASPEARALLMPVLVAAKKKDDKAKKKTSKKKKDAPKSDKKDAPKSPKKENPFAKGKAPPFGGKGAPPFGKGKKKKASVQIDASDANW